LLPILLPLVGGNGIIGGALSGAGPAVLAIVDSEANLERASAAIRKAVGDSQQVHLTLCRFEQSGVTQWAAASRD
jgi:homoserine kinase